MRGDADALPVSRESEVADAPTTPPTETTPGAASTPAASESKAPSAEEFAKVVAALKAANGEAKTYREKLDADAKAKAETEQKLLAEQGKWKELYESKDKALSEVSTKAAERDVLASELDAIKAIELATLPEDMRALVADLPTSKAIALARKLQAQNAGPRAAPAVNGGSPAGSTVPQKPFKDLSPAEQRAALAGKTPAEIRALTGVGPSKGIYS